MSARRTPRRHVAALAPCALALALLAACQPGSSQATAVGHGASALARWHVRVMTPAAAQDQNGVVVTEATARRLGLHKVSDLRRAAGRLILGGSPECPDRPYCLPGVARGIRVRLRRVPAARHR